MKEILHLYHASYIKKQTILIQICIISNICINWLYMTTVANNAHNYTKISYIHNDLLHVLANNVTSFRVVKYKGWIHNQSSHKILCVCAMVLLMHVDWLCYFSNLTSSVFIFCMLPNWCWPHNWPKHAGGECVYY